MDYAVLIGGIIGVAVLLWWIVLEPLSKDKEEVEEEVVVLSEAELKKMTKAQLVEYAQSRSIEVDSKLTKAKLVAALKKS